MSIQCIAHHHYSNLIINADNLHYHHGCSSKSFISLSAHSNSALSAAFHSNQKQSWQKKCKTIYILRLKSYILRLYITFYLLHLTILHSGLSSIQIRIRVSKKALQPGKLWFGPNYFLSPLWKWRSTLDLCCDFVKKRKKWADNFVVSFSNNRLALFVKNLVAIMSTNNVTYLSDNIAAVVWNNVFASLKIMGAKSQDICGM